MSSLPALVTHFEWMEGAVTLDVSSVGVPRTVSSDPLDMMIILIGSYRVMILKVEL